jgi:hypothetical protein
MRIDLTIDDLVLDGFDPRDRTRIADAVERELSCLRLPGRAEHPVALPPPRVANGREGSRDAVATAVRRSVTSAIADRIAR